MSFEKSIWTWVPRVAIGPFHFSQELDKEIIDELGISIAHRADGQIDEWDQFKTDDGNAFIAIDDGVISSVECAEILIFKGVNIIGLPEKYVRHLIGGDWQVGIFYNELQADNESHSITLWVSNGTVESVTVWGESEEPDE